MANPDVGKDETPAPPPETAKTDPADQPHVAKPGVKDRGHDVTGAGGERISGLIADIADGD
ncbi:MAG TPA: hypothetical protein VII73_09450 [Caulobacteraceae bacterium]